MTSKSFVLIPSGMSNISRDFERSTHLERNEWTRRPPSKRGETRRGMSVVRER